MYKVTLCLLVLVSVGRTAKILGIFMTPSISHQIVYQPIWKELSLRGHQVTVYTPNPLNDPELKNLTEMDLSFSYDKFGNYTERVAAGHWPSKTEEVRTVLKAYEELFDYQLASPVMQKLIRNENNEKYDLFLVEYFFPGMYVFKDVYNCPMVGITSLPLTVNNAENMGMVKHPVLDPNFILPFATDLTFTQRIISTLVYYLIKTLSLVSTVTKSTTIARKYLGQETREVLAIEKDVSLVLGNYNLAVQNIRPSVPAFIDISGIHLQPEKPLPKDLKQFLDEAVEGAIYFSLGTNVKTSGLSEEKLTLILSALSELPYKILWKFEKQNLKNLSSNVEIRQWFPQHDVLRHPNIKLFITQGGLQSIDESLNSNVPLLFIPFFGDQHFNAHKMTSSGAGLTINFFDFTKEELIEKINTIIQGPEFKKTVTRLGAIATDHQIPPLERAIWWIEYILRHEGAPHLRYKAVDMPLYQYYLLDVFLFLACFASLSIYILLKIFKTVTIAYRFCRGTLESLKISDLYLKKSQ